MASSANCAPHVRFRENVSWLISSTKDIMPYGGRAGFEIVSDILLDVGAERVSNYDDEKSIKMVRDFIVSTHEIWPEIKKRNQSLIETHFEQILGFFPNIGSYGPLYKKILLARKGDGTYLVPDEIRESFFETLHSLVKICIHHIHEGREPHTKIVNGKRQPAYGKSYFPEINFNVICKEWDMAGQLTFS